MKLLLDTHVLLWAVSEPSRLTGEARACLEDPDNEAMVSVVSVWEIALKQSLGKLDLPDTAERWLPEVLSRTGFEVAPLGSRPALRVRALPWHHRDPFDRLLLAHALEEGFTLVTHDKVFALYGAARIDA